MGFGSAAGGLAGLEAIDKVQRMERQRRADEVQAQKDEADLANLPDKSQSEKTGYQLRTGTNQQGLELLPGDTANKKTAQRMQGIGLDRAELRQPTEENTKDVRAQIGLSDANADQYNQPAKQRADKANATAGAMTAEANLQNLPDRLEAASMQGAIDEQGVSNVALGNLANFIADGNKAGAIDFANRLASKGNILPNTNGKTFVDIQPDKNGYKFVTADGEERVVPVSTLQTARQRLGTGEYSFLHTGDGSVFAGNKKTGEVKQGFKGDPNNLGKEHAPADVKTAEWLISKGIAKDPNRAWEMVRSAKEKTRQAFIMDYVSKNSNPGRERQSAQDAGLIYDQLKSETGGEGGQQSNTAPPPNMGNSKYKDLLGIP